MILHAEAFNALRDHWAVKAMRQSDLERAREIAKDRVVSRAVGERIDSRFTESAEDEDLLRRVAFVYQVAATTGLDALAGVLGTDATKRQVASAACHRAFGLLRVMPCPEFTLERLLHVLEVSAMACCGERPSDLRNWYRENPEVAQVPDVHGEPWDRRLLFRIFDCWIRLFRKRSWSDLHAVEQVVADLRRDQQEHESKLLDDAAEDEKRALAFRLAALYHWAKATELLGSYITQGDPPGILCALDQHFEDGVLGAEASRDMRLEMVLRWLHAAAKAMVRNSLWWAARTFSSKSIRFVQAVTRRASRPVLELLPPQRVALLERGLLDPAKTAVVVDLVSSGGKTLLAQFRMLQALNQFEADGGWVAYIVPTEDRAAQLTRRLRQDFEPAGIGVEQLTAAAASNVFEDELLQGSDRKFDVLVATPGKLSLVLRSNRVTRPLVLAVMEEAHDLDSDECGLNCELLLATIKRDCPRASFLLFTSFVDNPESVAGWLAEEPACGNTISLGAIPWDPNERIVGLFRAGSESSGSAGWKFVYEPVTTPRSMAIGGVRKVGGVRSLQSIRRSDVTGSDCSQKALARQAAGIATVISSRLAADSTSIAIADRARSAWAMARLATKELPLLAPVRDEIRLVQNFLKNEFGEHFELVEMLGHGVAVHHADMPGEARSLVEWLVQSGAIRVLRATTSITQAIDSPVSSVFLASRFADQDGCLKEISARDFWSLADRAGGARQGSIGVVGLAEGNDRQAVIDFVSRSTGGVVSRLVALLDELEEAGSLDDRSTPIFTAVTPP